MVEFRYVTTITQGFVRSLTDLTLGQVGDRVVLVGDPCGGRAVGLGRGGGRPEGPAGRQL